MVSVDRDTLDVTVQVRGVAANLWPYMPLAGQERPG
jgi:hypothetical protein